jgi:hypothetical protein
MLHNKWPQNSRDRCIRPDTAFCVYHCKEILGILRYRIDRTRCYSRRGICATSVWTPAVAPLTSRASRRRRKNTISLGGLCARNFLDSDARPPAVVALSRLSRERHGYAPLQETRHRLLEVGQEHGYLHSQFALYWLMP